MTLLFECPTCLKRFSQKSSLQRHEAHVHRGEKNHECPKCQLRFAQRTNLLQHLKRIHPTQPIGNLTYTCPHCSCIFTKLNSLNRHKTAQHSKTVTNRAFQDDDTPVDDPDALAQNVLVELKRLQSGMQYTQEEQIANTEPVVHSKPNAETICAEHTIVDTAATEVVTLKDKLNPCGQIQLINVQRIRRSGARTCCYVCEFCAKEFKAGYSFLRHRRLHTNERIYKCAYCEYSYQTKSRLQQHAKIHCLDEKLGTIKRQNACIICQRNYKSRRQLQLHMRSHSHSHTVNYTCVTCQVTFTTESGFSRHKHAMKQDAELTALKKLLPEPIILTHVEREEAANKAQDKDKLQSQLEQHERQHKRLKNLVCSACGRCYYSKSALHVHQRIHSGHKNYNCPHCLKRSYGTKSQLQRHMLHGHSEIRNFKCAYCTRCFKSKQNCRSHMATHLKRLLNEVPTEEEAAPLIQAISFAVTRTLVPKCLRAVKNQRTKTHTELTALQLLPNRKQNNFSISSLQQQSTATADIPALRLEKTAKNTCKHCYKQFQKPSDLLRHLRTHTLERPFVCSQCHKSYALQSTLQEHLITHETTRSRTYGCQVCGKSYASKKVLTVHLRLHTGERSFSCEFCNKTFRTSGHRISHMKVDKHTNEQFCLNALESICT